MSGTRPRSGGASRFRWPSLVTIAAAAVLVGTELLGAAWACGWALAGFFGLGPQLGLVLQGLLAVGAVLLVVAFVRKAIAIEPVALS